MTCMKRELRKIRRRATVKQEPELPTSEGPHCRTVMMNDNEQGQYHNN